MSAFRSSSPADWPGVPNTIPTLARPSTSCAAQRHRPRDRLEQALGGGRGAGDPVRVLEQERELVAAEARRRVDRPQALLQPGRDLDQELVAGGVAEAVVDRLEVVEVEEQQGDVVPAAPRTLERVLDAVQQQRAVRQPGERVVECLVRELVLEHAALGHVVRGQHDAVHRLLVQEVAEDSTPPCENRRRHAAGEAPAAPRARPRRRRAARREARSALGRADPSRFAPASSAGSCASIASTEGVT